MTGREIVFHRGRVLPAVIASSSIPGIVEPMKMDDMILVDGSTTSMVPIDATRKIFHGSKIKVIGIDVSLESKRDAEPSTAFEVALRAGEIANYYLTKISLGKADFVIHPNVGRTTWANFEKLDELVRAGETAAKKSLLQLKSKK